MGPLGAAAHKIWLRHVLVPGPLERRDVVVVARLPAVDVFEPARVHALAVHQEDARPADAPGVHLAVLPAVGEAPRAHARGGLSSSARTSGTSSAFSGSSP